MYEIVAFRWFYYKEICYDARSHERKNSWLIFLFRHARL